MRYGIGLRVVMVVATACAVSTGIRAEGGTLTIIGAGKGPVRVIEKDGTVTQVDPKSLPLNTQRTNSSSATAADTSEANANTSTPATEPEKTPEQIKAEAAKAAAEAKAAADAQKAKAKAKEAANYNDKEYTYGPGSANKVDQTGKMAGQRERNRSSFREDRPKAQSLRNESPPTTESTTTSDDTNADSLR